MKQFTNLTGETESTDRQPAAFPRASFGYEAVGEEKGENRRVQRRAMLAGPDGILFTNGRDQVFIPSAVLWSAVEGAEPGLAFDKELKTS